MVAAAANLSELDFQPTDEVAAAIFNALCQATRSLSDIAATHGTTLPALALWLEEPQTVARHNAFNSALAATVRTACLNQLPVAATALGRILAHCAANLATPAKPVPSQAPSSTPASSAAEPDHTFFRVASLGLRAASLLSRLSRVSGHPPAPPTPRAPQPPRAEPARARIATAMPRAVEHATSDIPSAETSPADAIPAASTVPAAASTPDSTASNPSAHTHQTTAADATAHAGHHAVAASPAGDDIDLERYYEMSDEELAAAVHRGEINPAKILAAAGLLPGPAP